MRRPGDSLPRKDDKGPNTRKFIDRNPTKQEGLPKNADRAMYGDHGVPGADGIPSGINDWQVHHSEQILTLHENQADAGQPQGADWMSQLKQNSMQFLADQNGLNLQDMYRDSVYKTGIAILIDKIYGLLQRYTFEFNQVVGGTDLHVAGTISGDVTEVTRYNRMREAQETATYFRCRFSTRHFALTVRGHDDTVECYLLPVNMVMALSQSENQYPPLCTIQVRISDQGMMWRMKDSEPPVDTLDQLCMWLFQKLIEETKLCLDRLEQGK